MFIGLSKENLKPRVLKVVRKVRSKLIHNMWIILGLGYVIFFFLGYLGYYRYYQSLTPPLHKTPQDLVYSIMRLFVMELEAGDVEGPIPWQLDVSRFLAPFLASFTALLALADLFLSKIWWLRARFYRDHVIIFGLDEIGREIADQALNRLEKVIIFEITEKHPYEEIYKRAGALVVAGNIANTYSLRRAMVDKAKYIFVVTADDLTNVEISLLIKDSIYIQNKAIKIVNTTHKIVCHVHLNEPERKVLFQHIMFDDQGLFSIKFFNHNTNAARILFRDNPPDSYVDTKKDGQVHLLLAGFGQAGESIALQAAMSGHYANFQKVKISVLDINAKEREIEFNAKYPYISHICDISFHQMDLERCNSQEGKLISELHKSCPITMAFFTMRHDISNISFAIRFRKELVDNLGNMPLFARVTREDSPIAEADNIIQFGSLAKSCSWNVVVDDELDYLAIANHEHYLDLCKSTRMAASKNPAMVPWKKLSEEYRESNRRQMDHLFGKLRAIGCTARPKQARYQEFEFAPSEIDLLARMEHSRWNADKYLSGWTYAPEEKNLVYKTTPYLVEYDQLDPEIKKFDINAVKNIPRLLDMIGLDIIRIPE